MISIMKSRRVAYPLDTPFVRSVAKMGDYVPKYKELDGIFAVILEMTHDKEKLIQLKTEPTKIIEFRQRLENAYERPF